jgi:hypothetical protein
MHEWGLAVAVSFVTVRLVVQQYLCNSCLPFGRGHMQWAEPFGDVTPIVTDTAGRQ